MCHPQSPPQRVAFVFSILPADQGRATSEPGEMGGDSGSDSSLMKTIRIVTTVQYYLDK